MVGRGLPRKLPFGEGHPREQHLALPSERWQCVSAGKHSHNTTHGNQSHSSQEDHPPASYFSLAFESQSSPSAVSYFSLNNTLGLFSVSFSERVALAALHPGGCTARPSLQPISLPLLRSGHSLQKLPLGSPGVCSSLTLYSLLKHWWPPFQAPHSSLLDHQHG